MNLKTLCITVDIDAEPDAIGDLLQILKHADVCFVETEQDATPDEQFEYCATYGDAEEFEQMAHDGEESDPIDVEFEDEYPLDDETLDRYVDRVASHVAEGGWISNKELDRVLGVRLEGARMDQLLGAIPQWVWRDSGVNYNNAVNDI